MQRNGSVYTVVFTGLLTAGLSLLLSAAHTFTIPITERNERMRYQGTVVRAMDIPATTAEEVFAQYASLEQGQHEPFYRTTLGEIDIVARRFTGPGVWGDITGAIAVTADMTRIIGIEIMEHNETPGLGGRITDRRFLDQFRSERIGPDGVTVVLRGPGNTDPEDATVDGITGASGTTRAFTRILQNELATLEELLSPAAAEG